MPTEPIVVYGSPHCGACMMLKRKLDAASIAYTYSTDVEALQTASALSGLMSAPLVKIGDKYYNAADASTLLYL